MPPLLRSSVAILVSIRLSSDSKRPNSKHSSIVVQRVTWLRGGSVFTERFSVSLDQFPLFNRKIIHGLIKMIIGINRFRIIHFVQNVSFWNPLDVKERKLNDFKKYALVEGNALVSGLFFFWNYGRNPGVVSKNICGRLPLFFHRSFFSERIYETFFNCMFTALVSICL